MPSTAPEARTNHRVLVYCAVVFVILARSAIFVFWNEAYFDSNQAVIGLMAKHLVEGRAFPVFMYGQTYMLAVEAYLAAPLFYVAGPSVAALKLPVLGINLAIGLLLVWRLERDTGLTPAAAALAAVFVVLPSPGTAAQLLEASGGIFDTALYVVLLWIAWRRPVLCGIVLGIGFLHRPFVAYGLAALVGLDAIRGTLLTRAGLTRMSKMLAAAAAIWVVVTFANTYSSAVGPGTTPADLRHAGSDLTAIADRFCIDPKTFPGSVRKLLTIHWPELFGTKVQRLIDYAISSRLSQGMPGAWILLAAAMGLAAVRVASRTARERGWDRQCDFAVYLTMVGALSAGVYVFARCGNINMARMRYDMLSLIGAVGLAGWYLRIERVRALRAIWIALVLAYAVMNATVHARLWNEYLRATPIFYKQLLIDELDARGIRYATSDYWLAYSISFLSNERIVVMSSNRTRIKEYERLFNAHRNDAVKIARSPCPGEAPVVPRIYFCPP